MSFSDVEWNESLDEVFRQVPAPKRSHQDAFGDDTFDESPAVAAELDAIARAVVVHPPRSDLRHLLRQQGGGTVGSSEPKIDASLVSPPVIRRVPAFNGEVYKACYKIKHNLQDVNLMDWDQEIDQLLLKVSLL
jgi:hypothetical protein